MNLQEQLPFPLNRGVSAVTHLGHTASYFFGRSQALDNIVEQDRQKEILRLEAARLVLSLDNPTTDEAVALGEINVVQRFAEVHGAKDHVQMEAIDIAAQPEPLASRLLDKLMAEEIADPVPRPPQPRVGDG